MRHSSRESLDHVKAPHYAITLKGVSHLDIKINEL